jgi:hypothetical protein
MTDKTKRMRWVLWIAFDITIIASWMFQPEWRDLKIANPKAANAALVGALVVVNGAMIAGLISSWEFKRRNASGTGGIGKREPSSVVRERNTPL